MKISSIRFKLTLWNIGILALALMVFLLVVHAVVRQYLVSATDDRLRAVSARSLAIIALFEDDPDRPPPRTDHRGSGGQRRERMTRMFDLQGNSITPFGGRTDTALAPWDRPGCLEARQGSTAFSTVTSQDSTLRVYSVPVERDGRIRAVLQIAVPFDDVMELLRRLSLTLAMLAPIALIAAGAGGLFLTNRALRPVRDIVEAANALSTDDLSRRLPASGSDEFAHLAETINGLLSRLERAFMELRDSVEHERRFTADASHELRTPLTAIKANASLALQGSRGAEDYREALAGIDQSANAMNRLIQDLLLLARSDSGQLSPGFEEVDARSVIEEAAAAVSRGTADPRLRVEIPDTALSLWADREQICRLLINLLDNAMRHTPAHGEVVLAASLREGDAILSVADTGEGMTPEQMAHAGERFYRADPSRTRGSGGTGLGLAICRSIVDAHAGTMTIESSPQGGTIVRVQLRSASG